jgi:hypothetical protein
VDGSDKVPEAPDGIRPKVDLGSSKRVDLIEGWWPEPSPAWTPTGRGSRTKIPSFAVYLFAPGLRLGGAFIFDRRADEQR